MSHFTKEEMDLMDHGVIDDWVREYLDADAGWEGVELDFSTCGRLMDSINLTEQAGTPFLRDGWWYYYELSYAIGFMRRKKAAR